MAASTVQNPAASLDSKSSKKKKAKAEASAPAVKVQVETAPSPAPESSNGDGAYESPYIKELYKSIRNVNKKIANASKVDNILAENPKASLDELVASRKINADQKAQILKKPALQSSLTQLEEQIAAYKKFDAEYKSKAQAEKDALEKSFTDKAEKDLSQALASTKAEAVAAATKEQQEGLLVLSQFLLLAAARRADEEEDAQKDENLALEGILLQVYGGNEVAVKVMIKLISGADEPVFSTLGEQLTTTYAQVKAQAIAQAPSTVSLEEAGAELEAPAVETADYPIGSDPTVVNAGLTEIDDIPTAPQTNGHHDAAAEMASVGIPQNSGIDEGASNAAADSHWESGNAGMDESQEWVSVPRDVSETETGVTATPAEGQAPQKTTHSWADETTEAAVPAATDAATNDGFHEVQRNRPQQNRGRGGRGGEGGRGGRGGGYRGDGFRGGRGRGGPRGGARGEGASRGGPRRGGEES